MSLYDEIIGHENIIAQLKRSAGQGKINHAYILAGGDGAGKNMIAKALAEALLCEKQGECGCGVCHACRQVASDNNPDLRYVIREKATLGVDDVRDQLVGDIQIKPYNGYHKVYIIDEAEKMTPQAQNAILKTIEEPPSYGVILLLTNNAETLLPTIRSRCITYECRPLKNSQIEDYLVSRLQIPDYEARVTASFAQGYLGKAILLAQSEEFSLMKEEALKLVRNVGHYDMGDVAEEIRQLNQYKANITDFLELLGLWYRDALLFKVTRDANRVIFSDELAQIRKQSSHSSYEGLEQILDAVETAKTRLRANVNFDLTMELLILTIKEN